ncbi:hypothetical protein SI65_01259 [Aspergillus cristatus]|uniref:Uncharacterized protein n=1 Tax=Aspergillus cristatus TaxID=573508 RepID=A0A1E3BRT2_ASPCR|nr:hypothetical protein SI65_01259 [Aspergillus cristatus]
MYYSYESPVQAQAWRSYSTFIGITAIICTYQYDHGSFLWQLYHTIDAASLLLDPTSCALKVKKKLEDGSEVTVKKPILAFKGYEKTTATFPGAAGSPLPKKWSFEKAYLRI